MIKRVSHPAIAAIAGALVLMGCASTPDNDVGLPQATAVEEIFRADMPVDARDNGLTWAQQDLLAAVAAEYKARGHGPLVISYPQGAANQEAAMRAIANARSYLYEAGVGWRQISGGAYDARGDQNGALVFSFRRYRAVGPDCEAGWDDLTQAFRNQSHDRFGCAMAANLAAMVSDPRDLIAPRDQDPADTGRRQTVIDRYRAGESTASNRSDYESGAVSNVSND